MTTSRRNHLFALIGAYAALGLVYATFGYQATWRLWGIPFGYPPFMDARVITAGAIAEREGLDPMSSNPADVAQRKLNYPRVWQALYRVGVNEHHGLALGLVFVGAFAVGTMLFVREPGGWTTGLLLAGIFSPAVMLGVERGNTDLLMFFLLAAAIVAAERSTGLALAFVLAAFGLKLFPLAGLAVLLRRPREEAVRAIAIGLALVALYLLYNYSDLRAIRAGTPEGAWIAFGKDVIQLRLEFFRHPWAGEARWVAWGVVLAVIGWSARSGLRRKEARLCAAVPMNLTAFRVGAACYLGAFVLGSNFDYRLAFLLFTIPQLTEWARGGSGATWWARSTLGWLLLAMWGLAIEQATTGVARLEWSGFFVGEVATWSLFGLVAVLFARSLPEWVAEMERGGAVEAQEARADAVATTR